MSKYAGSNILNTLAVRAMPLHNAVIEILKNSLSQADRQGLGCLLEKTWNGTKPVKMADGTERSYLEDGDTVILRGYCQGPSYRVGFGECKGKVLPSKTL